MVPIIKMPCPSNKYNIKCPYTRTPTRVVVHNTANDAPARNEVSYMENNNMEISYHVAIDDKEIIEAIPFERNAWASGDGTGKGNMEGIHIEICYSLSGGERFNQSEKNAAEYIASILKRYKWNINKVTKHQDYDGKYCPHRTLDLGWNRFLKMVENYLKEDEDMLSYEDFKKYMQKYETEVSKQGVSKWAKESWDKAVESKVFDGTNPRGSLTREQAAAVLDRVGVLNKE